MTGWVPEHCPSLDVTLGAEVGEAQLRGRTSISSTAGTVT